MKRFLLSLASVALLLPALAQPAADDELPAISKSNKLDFFIPATACAKYKLEIGQTDDWMKVYNNFGDDAAIQRVNDIRWQAKSKEEASTWFKQNKQMLGEGSKEITDKLSKPAGVDEWTVYGMNEKMQKMMEAMGLKQNQYNFTFTIDNYVGKIFVSTSEKQTLQDAWNFAREGVKATMKAAGKPKQAELML